jgi:PAS domain S-box-containing protein
MDPARRRWLVLGPAALVAGAVAAAFLATSDHQDSKLAIIAFVLPVGWAFVAAGLVAWTRQPANRVGPLMVAVGFAWFVNGLSGANSSFFFTISLVCELLAYGLLVHLLLAYPSGRLGSRFAVAVAALAYFTVTVLHWAWLLFQPFPNSGCDDCPANGLLIADRPALADAFDIASSVVGVCVLAATVVHFVVRWRRGTPHARRVLAPVAVAGTGFLVALVAVVVAEPFSDRVSSALFWFVLVTLLAVPVSFLVGLLRSRLATAGASRLLIETSETPSPQEAQEGLRRALNDPTLELFHWLPDRAVYVDTAGNRVELPLDGGGRATTPIEYEDRPVAALVHDESLLQEPEVVEAVAAAARLAIEKDRLQAELRARLDELERERDFVRTAIDTAPALFAVVDLEGRIVRFNETGTQMTGFPDDDTIRGRTFWEAFIDPEEADRVRDVLAEAAAGGRPAERENTFVTRTGDRLLLSWSTTPLLDAEGRPRLLVTGTDVTQRKRQEETIKRERDYLDTIANATPGLLVVLAEDGELAGEPFNEASRRVLGYSDADVGHRDFFETLIAPEDREQTRRQFGEVVSGRASGEFESRFVTRSGRYVPVAWSGVPLGRNVGDDRMIYLLHGVDVTERRHHEDELRASRARLVEAADLERRRLERNLHDGAQQRLVTLSLTLRLIESRLRGDPEAVRLLAGAREELAHALEELRELARGLHPAVLSDHGLRAAVSALADRSTVPVDVEHAIDGRLPEHVEVAAYFVVSEALANVQKYAGASNVTIALGTDDGAAVVEISDDGVGGADPAGGSGLRGLVDRVEALGGRLEIDSAAGAGTSVRARIPLRPTTPTALST